MDDAFRARHRRSACSKLSFAAVLASLQNSAAWGGAQRRQLGHTAQPQRLSQLNRLCGETNKPHMAAPWGFGTGLPAAVIASPCLP